MTGTSFSPTKMAAISPPPYFHHYYSSFNYLSLTPTFTFSPLKFHSFPRQKFPQTNRRHCHHYFPSSPIFSSSSHFNISVRKTTGYSDPELRAVLELATVSELFEIEKILFGPSYFSPLLKSINSGEVFDRFMIEEDFEEREHFIDALESRFLYLAADARSTMRGWRPLYKNVLLDVRKQLKVPCSTKFSTEDLEAEIFIHLLGECSRKWDTAAFLTAGTAELRSVLLKGGQLITLLKISELVSTKLSSKMLMGAAKYKVDGEVVKKGLTKAASRYFGLRSLATFIGPMLWGTFLADIVVQMLGTDYNRILQAIFAFAQIRTLRRHGLQLDKLRTEY